MRANALALSLIAVAAIACGDARPQPASHPPPDKARLFGDPLLVPSRDGEAARRELAAAGEIAAALRGGAIVDAAHVDVEDDARVVVSGRTAPDIDDDELRTRIEDVVDGVLGEDDTRRIVLAIDRSAAGPRAPSQRPAWPLVLAAIGLGASAGIAFDRAMRRRRLRGRGRRHAA